MKTLIKDLYLQNNSMFKIAKQLKISPRTVKKILQEQSVEIFDNNKYKSKTFNQTYFDTIDTSEKAYWLGFIYADGNITKRKISDRFQIKLNLEDISHLYKLKDCLCSNHSIGKYKMNTKYGLIKYCMFAISNQHLVDSLLDKGVVYQKTKQLKFPSTKVLPKEYVSHFIRGYFDGDGSIY